MNQKILFLDYLGSEDFNLEIGNFLDKVEKSEEIERDLKKRVEDMSYDKRMKIYGILISHGLVKVIETVGKRVVSEIVKKAKEVDYDKVSFLGNEAMFLVCVKSLGYLCQEITGSRFEGSFVVIDENKFELDDLEKDWDIAKIVVEVEKKWAENGLIDGERILRTLIDLIKKDLKKEDTMEFLYFVQELMMDVFEELGTSVRLFYTMFSGTVRNLDNWYKKLYEIGRKS